MLQRLLEAYARGETDAQHRLLEEVEPILFGYAKSMVPGHDHDRAVAVTNALTLAFHLRAAAGGITLRDRRELRRYAHKAVQKQLADPSPVPLADLADPETGSMVFRCLGLELELDDALDGTERRLLLRRLEGETAEWEPVREKLVSLGWLRP